MDDPTLTRSEEVDQALLFKAVSTGHLAFVKKTIDEFKKSGNSQLTSKDSDGRNILHYSCMYNQDDVATGILATHVSSYSTYSISPIVRDNYGATAVMYAARAGLTSFVSKWISGGYDIENIDNEGRNILHYCLGEGPTIPPIENSRQKTANEEKPESIIQLFIDAHKLPRKSNNCDVSPLMIAARNGLVSFVKEWINNKYEINQVDHCRQNVLHYALIEDNKDLPKRSKLWSPDSMAKITQLLLDAGADFLYEDIDVPSPLLEIINNEYIHILTYLLSDTARARKVWQILPTEEVGKFSNYRIYPRVMLQKNPINVVGGYMHLCLEESFDKDTKLRNEKRIENFQKTVETSKLNVNEVDDNGMTALHHLCYYQFDSEPYGLRDALVAKLLDIGADPNIEDKKGLTALKYAVDLGYAGGNDPQNETRIGKLLKKFCRTLQDNKS